MEARCGQDRRALEKRVKYTRESDLAHALLTVGTACRLRPEPMRFCLDLLQPVVYDASVNLDDLGLPRVAKSATSMNLVCPPIGLHLACEAVTKRHPRRCGMDAIAATIAAVAYQTGPCRPATPPTRDNPSRDYPDTTLPLRMFRLPLRAATSALSRRALISAIWTTMIWTTVIGTMAASTIGSSRCRADDTSPSVDETQATPAPADQSPAADLAAVAKQAIAAGKLVTGRLVICGGGRLPEQLPRRFIEFAGGEAARVVVVTTASVYADTDKMEPKLAFWRAQKMASLTILHTRSRATADEVEFAKPLTEATGVWFVGGNQSWLTETYLGTATERELRGVLARGGVVGGTSAGAAIMSPVMIRRDKPELETCSGFGFLPGTVVDQHFLKRNRQGRLMKVLDSHRDLVGLGIDEGTALVVEGNHLSVVGESEVVVCSPASTDRPAEVHSLAAGAEADLGELRTALVAHLVAKSVATAAADAPGGESVPAETSASLDPAAVSVSPPAETVKAGQ